MAWNWQDKNWPRFSYDAKKLEHFENEFLHKAGMLLGSLKHVSDDQKGSLMVDLISNEAYKTSEIEGDILNRDSLQSSIRKHFGLVTDDRRISPAVQGISDMMVDLYKTYDIDLSHEQLHSWNEKLTRGRTDLLDIGTCRTHEDPMQIVSGRLDSPTVHFEAPPSENVQQEMNAYIDWFNSSKSLQALTRAGVAHLYFESIHPYEDGNGRIGRALSEKALSQKLKRPTLIALSHIIESEKKTYYAALKANSVGLEINSWLIYFCKMVLKAQDYTQLTIDFLIEKGRFYHRFDGKLNERQKKVVDRIFKEGLHGFRGGLSADNYISITGTTASTATRDLQKLVGMGALTRTGERKGTRYYLNIEHPKNGQ